MRIELKAIGLVRTNAQKLPAIGASLMWRERSLSMKNT